MACSQSTWDYSNNEIITILQQLIFEPIKYYLFDNSTVYLSISWHIRQVRHNMTGDTLCSGYTFRLTLLWCPQAPHLTSPVDCYVFDCLNRDQRIDVYLRVDHVFETNLSPSPLSKSGSTGNQIILHRPSPVEWYVLLSISIQLSMTGGQNNLWSWPFPTWSWFYRCQITCNIWHIFFTYLFIDGSDKQSQYLHNNIRMTVWHCNATHVHGNTFPSSLNSSSILHLFRVGVGKRLQLIWGGR